MNALLYGTPMKLVDGGVNYRAYTHIDEVIYHSMKYYVDPFRARPKA